MKIVVHKIHPARKNTVLSYKKYKLYDRPERPCTMQLAKNRERKAGPISSLSE